MLNSRTLEAVQALGASVSTLALPADPSKPDGLIELQIGTKTVRFAVEAKQRSPYPAEIARFDPVRDALRRWGTPLLLVPHLSEGQAQALTEHGWSWADSHGNFDLRTEDVVLRNWEKRARPRGRSTRVFPHGWAGLRLLRTLISAPGSEGVRTGETATAAKVSPQRASQVLSQLRGGGFVDKLDDGSWHVDRPALLDLFLEEYPGPGGDERTFYALDVSAAAQEIASRSPLNVVVSGDIAADLLAPYRRPSHLIVYGRDAQPVSSDKLVATPTRADANVFLVQPWDTSLFPHKPLVEAFSGTDLSLADPTQVAWDLARLGGSDRLAQLDRLKAWILRSR